MEEELAWKLENRIQCGEWKLAVVGIIEVKTVKSEGVVS